MKNEKMQLGFKQALEYILDVLCFAYYVKSDNLVSDQVYDSLEKMYCAITGAPAAPRRGIERQNGYSTGVVWLYGEIKRCLAQSGKDIKAGLDDDCPFDVPEDLETGEFHEYEDAPD